MADAYRVEWTLTALRDLDEITHYIATHDSAGAAERVHGRIVPRTDLLAAHPMRCRIVPELRAVGLLHFRELLVPPYRIPFEIAGRRVVIRGVLDARRDLAELLLARALEE